MRQTDRQTGRLEYRAKTNLCTEKGRERREGKGEIDKQTRRQKQGQTNIKVEQVRSPPPPPPPAAPKPPPSLPIP